MRDENNTNYVPVTVDELLYHFCTTKNRKQVKTYRDNHSNELMKESLVGKSNNDVKNHVYEVCEAWNDILGDNSEKFSRFKNEQNKTYLQLLEKASNLEERNSLLKGTTKY